MNFNRHEADNKVTPEITSRAEDSIQNILMESTNFSQTYALQERLGKGGYGVTYRAKRLKKTPTKNRYVAVKILDHYSGKWQREVRALTALKQCENIVTIHEVYVDRRGDRVLLVMDLMDTDLKAILRDNYFLASNAQVVLAREVLKGLTYMHGLGIVHKDIKPSNILLAARSPHVSVKIGDFGCSAFVETDPFQCTGTGYFMAPEVCNKTCCGTKADVWSLGIMMLQMRYGRIPFQSEFHIRQVREFVGSLKTYPQSEIVRQNHPRWCKWEDMVNKCLTVDLMKRPSSADLLKHNLVAEHLQEEKRQTSQLLPYVDKGSAYACSVC